MPIGVSLSSTRRLGLLGAAGPVIFTLAWIVSAVIQSDYSVRREDISGLAAETADAAWLMIAGFVVMGSCTILLGVGLLRALGGPLRRRIGPVLVVSAGVAIIGAGLFRNDCSSTRAECEALIEAGDVSWQHSAHDLVSGVLFLAFILAPLCTGWGLRGKPYWQPLSLPSMLLTPVLIVLVTLYAGEAFPAWNGVMQRLLVSSAFLWLAVMGLRLYAMPASDLRTPPTDSPPSRG